MADSLAGLGKICILLADYPKAIEHYQQVLEIVRQIGDRRGEGNALFNSSLVLYELDKRSEAIKNAETALEIYRLIESPFAARVEQLLAKWKK